MKRPGIWSRLVGLLDDLLPVPGDERAEEQSRRGEGTVDDETRSRRRRLLLRLREKAGRGGFR